MPGDLNAANTLFGGTALSWVDEAAAMYIMSEIKHYRLVTKKMSEVDFIAPARQGDMVEIGVQLKQLGKTSVTVDVEVRNERTKQTIAHIDEIVFVCLDEEGKPTKHGMVK
ncbi:MAG: hotdog domain-containing protein [Betaproteobacteria bacterium]